MGYIGSIVVVLCVFGGFIAAGGHMAPLLKAAPLEIVIIMGAAFGGYLIGNPMKTVKLGLAMAFKTMAKSSCGPSKKEYLELLQMMFQLFQIFRKDGPQAVEKHVEEPEKSEIFTAYPSFLNNHHAVAYLCDTMKITLSADLTQHDVDDLLDTDLKVVHQEEHAAQHAIQMMGDGLPGLGIVAAVLGVVKTMGYLNEGVEKIGASVGAALVGTFLGVFFAYGFVNPIATKMHNEIDGQGRYLAVIKAALVALQKGAPPLVCVEYARRSIFPDVRPTFNEMDVATKEAKSRTAQAA